MWSRNHYHANSWRLLRNFQRQLKKPAFLAVVGYFSKFHTFTRLFKAAKKKILIFFISTYFFNNKLIISATFLDLTEMKFDLVVFLHFKIIFISRTPFYQIILVLLSLIKQNYNCIVKSVFLILSKTFRTLIYL